MLILLKDYIRYLLGMKVMELLEAIKIDRFPCVISIIGAGGKTSTMRLLAKELSLRGKRIIATTTTHLGLDQGLAFGTLILEEDYDKALKGIQQGFQSANVICLASREVPGNKIEGIPDYWIKGLLEYGGVDAIIVEADGAKGKSFKAPEKFEPVIPRDNDIVILVVGIDALNQPVNSKYIHRPEKVLRLLGNRDDGIGLKLSMDMMAKVIFHRDGLLGKVDRKEPVYLLFNKVDEGRKEDAIQLAKWILKENRVHRYEKLKVLIGQVQNQRDPISLVLDAKTL